MPAARDRGGAGLWRRPQRPNVLALKPPLCSLCQTGPRGRQDSVGAPEQRGTAFPPRHMGQPGGGKKSVPSTYNPLIPAQPLALETATTHGRATQGRICLCPPCLSPGGAGTMPSAIPARGQGDPSVPRVCSCPSALCCSWLGLLGFPRQPELLRQQCLVFPGRNLLSLSASQQSCVLVWGSHRAPREGRRVLGRCCKCLGSNLGWSSGTHSPCLNLLLRSCRGVPLLPKTSLGLCPNQP